MATKSKKKSSTSARDNVRVTRIKADTQPKTKQLLKKITKPKPAPAQTEANSQSSTTVKRSPLGRLSQYFKESWREIKLVRWPSHKQTWKMVLAVIIYSGFFFGLVVVLDFLFRELFKLMIG